MIPLTLAEVASAVGGRLTDGTAAGAVVTGQVVVDSRQVGAGDLFVALPGERVDGHDYAGPARERGAVAVLSQRPTGGPGVLVEDPVAALGLLARAVRDRLPDLTAIGVTGSSGKTSTKDLLAQVLLGRGPTVAPQNSFNNEIGVPLTLLRCDPGTRYLVSEMGARRPGNIAYLCGVVAPTVAVVLNVGAAHAGVFGSREVTAATKGELVEALPSDGLAVLNADDPLVAVMGARTTARVLRTGRADGPGAQRGPLDVEARDVVLDGTAQPGFTLVSRMPEQPGEAAVRLRLHGEHHVANALAVAAVSLALGATPAEVAAGLSAAVPTSTGRMQVGLREDGVVVIDDSYNANPDSMAAALRALVRIEAPGGVTRRRWAVLGEMLELGPDGPLEHERIGALAHELGVSRLMAVGPGAGAYRAATWVEDVAEAQAVLRRALRPGDVVLVKASRAAGLDVVARALLEPAPSTGQDDHAADGDTTAPSGAQGAPSRPGEVLA